VRYKSWSRALIPNAGASHQPDPCKAVHALFWVLVTTTRLSDTMSNQCWADQGQSKEGDLKCPQHLIFNTSV